MRSGILFDLDGTLWDTVEPLTKSWNLVLRQKGLPSITLQQMKSYMGKTPDEISALMLPSLSLNERRTVIKDCFQAENEYLSLHGGILYPHLEETLSALSKRYPLFIVSNCSHGYIETFWGYHHLQKYFTDMEYAGRTGKGKGQNIRILMKRHNLQKAVYVGDTMGDLEACKEAGIPFIFASYGFGFVPPDFPSISSFQQLPDLAEKILNSDSTAI